MFNELRKTFLVAFFLILPILLASLTMTFADPGQSDEKEIKVRSATLEECIGEALENNHRRPASWYAVEMAEAQHQQTLAAYWPQITAHGGYQHRDQSENFIFPAANMPIPMGGSLPITIPGLGTIPLDSIEVPAQDVKLMNKESYRASVAATWLLYDGDMRKGYRQQSGGMLEMMKQESRRTDLEIEDSVRRLYFGAVLAAQLHQVGSDTLARMEATLHLTEILYKEGSGRVKKTDWLDNKMSVDSLRSMVALLKKNELMAQAALASTMGLSWDSSIKPVDTKIPFTPFKYGLEELVGTAYQFSPDWAKLEAGLHAAEGALKTAKSGHYPKIALSGELFKWWNDYNGGIATKRNKEGWTVGAGLEIPLFSGFLTQNKIREAKARIRKIKEERFLLEEGLGLQIRDILLGLKATEKSYQATLDALNASSESRDLNTRAYQLELVDTEKVVRAQLMEALMSAQHYKAGFDYITLQSQLNLVVGTEILKKIEN